MINCSLLLHRDDDHPTTVELSAAPYMLVVSAIVTSPATDERVIEVASVYRLLHRTWTPPASCETAVATYLFDRIQ